MNGSEVALCYRRAIVQQASGARLVCILYDMLVADLRYAINAMQDRNVDERSTHLKHALSILELLDGSLDPGFDEKAVRSLSQFYGLLRNQLVTAQFESDHRLLEKQIDLILQVREAWQQADAGAVTQPSDPIGLVAKPEQTPSESEPSSVSQWIA
jgi:flagellar biosynthetic protein FliS